jgi:Flp pilus assembly pilin Flp
MINRIFKKKKRIQKTSAGSTIIEYVLIVTSIIMVLVGACRTLGHKYSGIYNNIFNALQDVK